MSSCFQCNHAVWQITCSKDKEKEKAVEESIGHLKTLENELKDKKFFGGETIGVVDIVANIIGFWLEALQEALGIELLTRERFPILSKWIDEYVSCNIVKENLPPRDKLVAAFRAILNAPA